jgi:putative flippase GtrA
MLTYIKAQAALIARSLVDFAITILLKEIFHCWYIIANLTGNIAGAITLFILSRNWAFNADKTKVRSQLLKFILVWVGNLILSAIGVYLFTNCFSVNYIISKVITSVILGLTYNYFFQKKFVFA